MSAFIGFLAMAGWKHEKTVEQLEFFMILTVVHRRKIPVAFDRL